MRDEGIKVMAVFDNTTGPLFQKIKEGYENDLAEGLGFRCKCVETGKPSSLKEYEEIQKLRDDTLDAMMYGLWGTKRKESKVEMTGPKIGIFGTPRCNMRRHSGRYPWEPQRVDFTPKFKPRRSCTDYVFADPNHISEHLLHDYDIDFDLDKFAYVNNGIVSRVAIDRQMYEEACEASICEEENLREHIIEELAKNYDKAMIKEVFNMKYEDFVCVRNKARLLGGDLEIEFRSISGYETCDDGVTVRIEIPAANLAELFDMEPKNKCEADDKITVSPYIPIIKDIRFFNNRATIVDFIDGTQTKSVCDDNDTFSEDVGIAYCLFKSMLMNSKIGKIGNGTKEFNRLMRMARQRYDIIGRMKQNDEEKKLELKRQNAKKAEASRKRKAKKRQEKVDLIADAIRQSKVVGPDERMEVFGND